MPLTGVRPGLPPRGQAWRMVYGAAAGALAVEGNDPADGVWLAAFLEPWFESSGNGGAAILGTVQVRRSGVAAARLERLAGGWHEDVAAFGLDTQTVRLPGTRSRGRLWMADAEAGCFYRLHGSRIDIVAPRAARRARLGVLRVVREILVARLLAAGRMDLHAAACAVGGRGILIGGRKRAGKTTVLSHMLQSAGAALVANDRVLVESGVVAGPVVRGVPTVVSVRPGTARRFPGLGCSAGEPPVLRHAQERVVVESGRPGPENLLLAPWQMAAAFAVPRMAEVPLAVMLFPEVDETVDGLSLCRLRPEQARERLLACRYGAGAGREATVLAAWAGAAARLLTDDHASWSALAASVPAYSCRLGPEAYATPAAEWWRMMGLAMPGRP